MIMKPFFILFLVAFSFRVGYTQSLDPWRIKATAIDPANYYGITSANGMIGIVSSPDPFKVKEVVLAGAYDLYGRGREVTRAKSMGVLSLEV